MPKKRIFVISPSKSIADNVTAISERFVPVQTLHITRLDYLKAFEGTVSSEDLTILDASGGFSPQQLNDGLIWAKTQRTVFGAGVLLIEPKGGTATPVQVLPEGIDAAYSIDVLQHNDWPRVLIGWLYRQFHPFDRRIHDSEGVLRLMGGRAVSVLIGELFGSSQFSAKNGMQETDTESVAFRKEIISDTEFNWGYADRIVYELPPLLWVCVSEALASTGSGEFEGLGKFERSYTSGDLSILFAPDMSFANVMVPDLSFSVAALSQKTRDAINISFPYLPAVLYELLSSNNGEKKASSALLANFLTQIASVIVNAPDYQSNQGIQEFGEFADATQAWIGLFGRVAAFAGYYITLAASSRSLHEHKELSIPMIGTFSRDGIEIAFKPTSDLLEFIDANPLERSVSR